MSQDLPALYQLGIVGSGQIARMTHQAAVKLGITPRLFAERFDDSAALAAPGAVVNHPDALAAFAEDCQVITFEHERLDMGLLQAMEQHGNILRPGTKTLRFAFDKLHQRLLLGKRGFNVPSFAAIRGPDDVYDFATTHGLPLVLKSIHAAQPGQRGMWILDDMDQAMKVLNEHPQVDFMAESYQQIIKELVVVLVRRPGGNIRLYPIAEVYNQGGVCHEIRSPADIGQHLASEVCQLARRIAEATEAVGVLAIEMLLTTDGLMINELSARPHNAGHFSIEGTPTSQFENHVRAVLDLPLGSTSSVSPAAVTVNILGGYDNTDPAQHLVEALAIEGARIHLYGKLPKPWRKLGHITVLSDDMEQASELARRTEATLLGRRQF